MRSYKRCGPDELATQKLLARTPLRKLQKQAATHAPHGLYIGSTSLQRDLHDPLRLKYNMARPGMQACVLSVDSRAKGQAFALSSLKLFLFLRFPIALQLGQ